MKTVPAIPKAKFSPILIIAIAGGIIASIVPIDEAIVIIFLSISAGLWGTLTLLATDQIEARLKLNLEEMEKKGKVGRRQKLAASWPKKALRVGGRMWLLATATFGTELAIRPARPFFQLDNLDELLFITGIIGMVLAGVETGNIFEFIGNRGYKPSLTSSQVAAGLLTGGVLIIDTYFEIFALLILPHYSALPLWIDIFGILNVVSVVGSFPFIKNLWSKPTPRLHSVAMWTFMLPFLFIIFIGILIRLGVKL